MKIFLDITRILLLNKWFYFILFATGMSVTSQFLRRQNLLPDQAISIAMLILAILTVIFHAKLFVELRAEALGRSERSTFELFSSMMWFSFKAFVACIPLIIIGFILCYPLVGEYTKYTSGNLELATLTPKLLLPLVYGLFLLALVFALMKAGLSLVAARGHSKHSVRGSFKAIRHIWMELFLLLLVTLVPFFVSFPIEVMKEIWKTPLITYLALGTELFFVPFNVVMNAAGMFYLSKLLMERDPELAKSASEPGHQSITNEA